MLFILLTPVLFAFSTFFATRAVKSVGAPRATTVRILMAAGLLGCWALLRGSSLDAPTQEWLWLSGAVGIGLGDIALFQAIPRIGGRLTSLLTQTLAAPIAALVEWRWLGTELQPAQIICASVILAGIALSLAPDKGPQVSRPSFSIGVLFGVISAAGQGMGAVLSRRAFAGLPMGSHPDSGTVAFHRVLAGALCTVIFYLPLLSRQRGIADAETGANQRQQNKPAKPANYWPVLFNALCGAVLGIACFQKALSIAPAGPVLAVAATSPLLAMVLLWLLDGVHPPRLAPLGGILAVAGVMALKLVHAGP